MEPATKPTESKSARNKSTDSTSQLQIDKENNPRRAGHESDTTENFYRTPPWKFTEELVECDENNMV